MLKVLKKLKEEQTLAEIYDVHSPESCTVGYVVDYDDDFYIIESVTPDGRYDGFQCRVTDDIIKIQCGTSYVDALEKLMPIYNFFRKEMPLDGKTVLQQVFDYVGKLKKICTVVVGGGDCYLCGYISDVSEGLITVEKRNTRGAADGIGIVRVEDIDLISVDSEDEIKLEILSK